MTYKICYGDYPLFDIEYYMKSVDKGDGWYSEIRCLPIVEGITRFLRYKFMSNDFDYEQFIRDAEGVQEIRGILYETYDNRPKDSGDAHQFHYHVFYEALVKVIHEFADKYGLFIDID